MALKYYPFAAVAAPTGVSRCIIGFGEAGFIIPAGDYVNHQPFGGGIGSSYGMPVPYTGKAKNLRVMVVSNGLDGDCIVSVARNEESTPLSVTIPAGSTGLFENSSDEVEFLNGERIFFIIDTRQATSGSIDIAGASVLYEG